MKQIDLAKQRLSSFFSPEEVLPDCKETTRDGILRALTHSLATHHKFAVSEEAIFQAVRAREDESCTVIAKGVALPHCRLEGIKRPHAAVATFPNGVYFAPGVEPLKVVFFLIVPYDLPALYLRILRSIGMLLQQEGAVDRLAAMTTGEEISGFFGLAAADLPAYITAVDIMNRDFLYLRDTDTVQTGVDTFISRKVEEVPVLDAAGKLVGIARADQFLRACLPEYLMWMQDLTPIANFQPFAQILRDERSAPLSSLVVKEFPAVSPDTPAVAVAGELARIHSAYCYVVEDGRLIGVIRLAEFLHKIFRD